MRQEGNDTRKKLRRKRQTPIRIITGGMLTVAVFVGIWSYNQYNVRKSIEAANNTTLTGNINSRDSGNAGNTVDYGSNANTYIPENQNGSVYSDNLSGSGQSTLETVSREELQKKMQEAGMPVDENGNLTIGGVSLDGLREQFGAGNAGSGADGSDKSGSSSTVNTTNSSDSSGNSGVTTSGTTGSTTSGTSKTSGVKTIECKKTPSGDCIYTVDGKATTERPSLFAEKEFYYNGVHYKKNTAVKAWLILGVDNVGSLQIDRKISEIGLSDGIFLVAEDKAKNKVHIIQVPRDTMTTITVTDSNSDPIGTATDHLTRAWMYGDNHAKSGKYAMEAVSGVFGGLPINGYMAGSIDVIKELNDYVGGVEVTINEDGLEAADPAFVKGKTVLLNGEQAEKFVRRRDVNVDFSAIYRMKRHRQYMIAFENKVLKLQKKDSDTIPGLFELIENNIVTDMSKGTYLKIALDIALNNEKFTNDNFSNLEGKSVVNHEENLDEFWPDYEYLDKLTLKYFFRSV
ncbi:LCP family protein [Oribacterium sp. WCC10]|uniref:LCP family protein n=1 Tax=Oribacterium sp. WCC10 TaxID=1855343 RepID=UPI0008EE1B17|nr:LCP family protein [Oribacterium sp. WCC10]SFG65484.1 cell envelope-related function transcriptional attenuator common domain-containing protein [Oribacterium sp. WCC10]